MAVFLMQKDLERGADKENGKAEDFKMQTLETSYRTVKGCDIP